LPFFVNLAEYFGYAKNDQLVSKSVSAFAKGYLRQYVLTALQKFYLTWSVGLQTNNRLAADLRKGNRSSKRYRKVGLITP